MGKEKKKEKILTTHTCICWHREIRKPNPMPSFHSMGQLLLCKSCRHLPHTLCPKIPRICIQSVFTMFEKKNYFSINIVTIKWTNVTSPSHCHLGLLTCTSFMYSPPAGAGNISDANMNLLWSGAQLVSHMDLNKFLTQDVHLLKTPSAIAMLDSMS